MSMVAAALKLLRYTCAKCTYGVSVARPPARCPMCGGCAWRPDARR